MNFGIAWGESRGTSSPVLSQRPLVHSSAISRFLFRYYLLSRETIPLRVRSPSASSVIRMRNQRDALLGKQYPIYVARAALRGALSALNMHHYANANPLTRTPVYAHAALAASHNHHLIREPQFVLVNIYAPGVRSHLHAAFAATSARK